MSWPDTRTARCGLLLVVHAVLAAGLVAQAVSIPVTNASFESPAIPAGTFSTTSAPPGWGVYGSGIDFGFRTIGVLDPNTTTLYSAAVRDGENVGVVFLLDDQGDQTNFAGIEAGMEQTLTTPLATNTRYTLSVRVGNITDDPNPPHNQFQFSGFPGYRVELLAGGVTLDSDPNTLLPAEGGFLLSTVDFTTGSSHAQAGSMLGIRLVNLNAAPGLEVNFDDVRLVARPSTAIPALGVEGLIGLTAVLAIAGGIFVVRRGRGGASVATAS